jgi:hypothetical protein
MYLAGDPFKAFLDADQTHRQDHGRPRLKKPVKK